MFEKHLWKSDILSKDADHRLASLLKMSLFQTCLLNILLVKPTTWFLHKCRTLVKSGLKKNVSLWVKVCLFPWSYRPILFFQHSPSIRIKRFFIKANILGILVTFRMAAKTTTSKIYERDKNNLIVEEEI